MNKITSNIIGYKVINNIQGVLRDGTLAKSGRWWCTTWKALLWSCQWRPERAWMSESQFLSRLSLLGFEAKTTWFCWARRSPICIRRFRHYKKKVPGAQGKCNQNQGEEDSFPSKHWQHQLCMRDPRVSNSLPIPRQPYHYHWQYWRRC